MLQSIRAQTALLQRAIVRGRGIVQELRLAGGAVGNVITDSDTNEAVWGTSTAQCCSSINDQLGAVKTSLDVAAADVAQLQNQLDTLTLLVDNCCGIVPPPPGRSVNIENQTAATTLVVYASVDGGAASPVATLAPAASTLYPIADSFHGSLLVTAWPLNRGPAPGATTFYLHANQIASPNPLDTFALETIPPGGKVPQGPRDAAVAASEALGYTEQQARSYNVGMDLTPPSGIPVECTDITGACPQAVTFQDDTASPKQQTITAAGNYLLALRDPVITDIHIVQPDLKGLNIDDTTAALVPALGGTIPQDWLDGGAAPVREWRTFHYADQTPAAAWVRYAVQNNIKVIVGLTLGSDSAAAEIAAFSADYIAADPALRAQYNANVRAIAVGNEQTNVSAMIAGVTAVRTRIANSQLPNVPVTSVLNLNPSTNPEYWVTNAFPPADAVFTPNALALLPLLDVIAFNVYPYFTLGNVPGATLERCLSWTSTAITFSVLLNSCGGVRFAMAKAGLVSKPFWVTETGWSSQLINPAEAPGWSSLPHLETYYRNFLAFDPTAPYVPQNATEPVFPPERIWWYATRDIPSRPEWFGLYTDAAVLTPKF